MVSKKLLSEAVQEFLELSSQESAQIRHQRYELYEWAEDDRISTKKTIAVPSLKKWAKNPPDEATKIETLIEALVFDADIPLIQTEMAARSVFENAIREIRIESHRGHPNELPNNADLWDALHSNEVTIEYLIPIIGLSFDETVCITDNLHIRRVNEFEKELMLNANTLGGGSVALRRAIELGSLTDMAVYEYTTSLEDGWQNGMGALSNISGQIYDVIEDLRIALRITHPEEFQMGVWHVVDKTFYPTVFSSHESHESNSHGGVVEPFLVSDADKIAEYYQLVSEAEVDEGLRVAIDRLESSYQKVSDADAVVDAVIGIEALLSSGHSGSFQEVRRRAAILSKEKATYSELGRIQSLRNKTVHGEETQVGKEDLEQVRDLLTVLLDQVLTITIQREITRREVVDLLDSAITETVETRFQELISEFEST